MAAMAQTEEDEPIGFVNATYFFSDAGGADRADEIFKKINAPGLNKQVKEVSLQGWGWLAHHTGALFIAEASDE